MIATQECPVCSLTCGCSTGTFSILEALIQISQLIGPIIGSSLLMLGVYVPFYFIFPATFISIPLTLCLPHRATCDNSTEPLLSGQESYVRCGRHVHSEEQQLLRNGSSCSVLKYVRVDGAEVSDLMSLVAAYGQGISKFHTFCDKLRADVVTFTKMFKEFPVVQYSFAALLVTTLGKQALHVLLQYVSKRFGVSVAQVSSINSPHRILQLICL